MSEFFFIFSFSSHYTFYVKLGSLVEFLCPVFARKKLKNHLWKLTHKVEQLQLCLHHIGPLHTWQRVVEIWSVWHRMPKLQLDLCERLLHEKKSNKILFNKKNKNKHKVFFNKYNKYKLQNKCCWLSSSLKKFSNRNVYNSPQMILKI